jgi:hypothetical protein
MREIRTGRDHTLPPPRLGPGERINDALLEICERLERLADRLEEPPQPALRLVTGEEPAPLRPGA